MRRAGGGVDGDDRLALLFVAAFDRDGVIAGGDELAFGTFRELSGLTRKLGIPMLEHLDETGRTRRDGDVRRAGPNLEDDS